MSSTCRRPGTKPLAHTPNWGLARSAPKRGSFCPVGKNCRVSGAIVPGPRSSYGRRRFRHDVRGVAPGEAGRARARPSRGPLSRIGPEVALVDVGGKSEAVIDVERAEGRRRRARGRRRRSHPGRWWCPRPAACSSRASSARGAATDRQLEDAFRAGLPVEGTVEKAVKGGYEVRIARQRAFCPLSQIDTVRTADPAVHVGQGLHVPDHRVQGRRPEPGRLAPRAARGGAAGQRRRSPPARSSPARC